MNNINNIIIILLLQQQNKQGDETQSRHPRLAHILIHGKQAPTPRNRGTGSGQRLVHGQGNKCGPFRLGSGFGALRLCIRCLSPLLLSVDSKHHWRGPRFGSTFYATVSTACLLVCVGWYFKYHCLGNLDSKIQILIFTMIWGVFCLLYRLSTIHGTYSTQPNQFFKVYVCRP